MAKKKEIIDFRNKNIEFDIEGEKYKLLCFKKANMTVELILIEKEKSKIIPFAHLPKSIKSLIKPNN